MERDRNIEARGWELIGLVTAELPRESEVTSDADAWPMIAAALTSRITGTMRSILRLLPDGVETDAGILLRTLYDHAVTLAWLAADPAPTRIRRWRKDDLQKRLKVDDDTRNIGEPLLGPHERQQMEAQVARITEPSLPPLTVLAEQADSHWEGQIPGMGLLGEIKSFRGFYSLVFRHNSFFAHASLLGLNPVVEDLSATHRRVGLEGHYEGTGPYGMATLIFGFVLYVMADSLGWPERSQITEVFERHPTD